MEDQLKGLNKEQQEAALHREGPCMVLAGPGTGKTTVITARIKNLISTGVSPENILTVTFSKAAADEMKERFQRIAPRSYKRDGVTFGTFHSVFFRILKQFKDYKLENLLDENQKFNIMKTIIKKMNVDYCEDDEQIGDIINDMGYFLSTMTDILDFEPESCKLEHFKHILEEYFRVKQGMKKFDYDDMLLDCYDLLKSNIRITKAIRDKYRYILVDEFQDINPVQFEALKLIAEPENNLFVVGDDDQSIYGFRGATPNILLDFEKLYIKSRRIYLRNNYRTPENILGAAMNLINKNNNRYEKPLVSKIQHKSLPKQIETEDMEDEARIIAQRAIGYMEQNILPSQIAVIYRTNLQSRAVVDAFMDYNIPFVAFDGAASIYKHWVFKDILSYFKLAIGYDKVNDGKHVLRIINKPKRYISREALAKAEKLNGDILENLINYGGFNSLQVNALWDFKASLKRIAAMNPVQALRFIRYTIGYDEYIREYCYNKGIKPKGLFEVLDEAEGSAALSSSIAQYVQHTEEVEEKLFKGRDSSRKAETKDCIRLLTMHKAKGLEFDVVFICGAMEGLAPYFKAEKPDEEAIEEERRLFYVAMTRAKKELLISVPKYRYSKKAAASRFIGEMVGGTRQINNMVEVGQRIYHKLYEEGFVKQIVSAKEDTRIIVEFSVGKKELNLRVCLQNDIIKLL